MRIHSSVYVGTLTLLSLLHDLPFSLTALIGSGVYNTKYKVNNIINNGMKLNEKNSYDYHNPDSNNNSKNDRENQRLIGIRPFFIDAAALSAARSIAICNVTVEEIPHGHTLFSVTGAHLSIPYEFKSIISESTDTKSYRKQVEDAIKEVIKVMDDVFFYENSQLRTLIKAADDNKPHKLNEHIFKVVECAWKVYAASLGAYDPSSNKNSEIGKKIKRNRIYDGENGAEDGATTSITSGATKSLSQNWKFNAQERTLCKVNQDASLDLNTIAQGYAIDLLSKKLFFELGFKDSLLCWGDHCRAAPVSHVGRSAWVIRVPRPKDIIVVENVTDETKVNTEEKNSINNPQDEVFISASVLIDEAISTISDADFYLNNGNANFCRCGCWTQVTVKAKNCRSAAAFALASLFTARAQTSTQMEMTCCCCCGVGKGVLSSLSSLCNCCNNNNNTIKRILRDPHTLDYYPYCYHDGDNNYNHCCYKWSSADESHALSSVKSMLQGEYARTEGVTDFTAFMRDEERVASLHEVGEKMMGGRGWALLMKSDEVKQLQQHRQEKEKNKPHVIVVGGGLAGLSAAIEAAHAGAFVTMIEKCKRVGGNSAKATSGINGWGTKAQRDKAIADGPRLFERDTFLSGKGGECQSSLVKRLSWRSSDAVRWLTDTFGIPLTVISQLGGHSKPRTHRLPDNPNGSPAPVGYTLISTLEKYIKDNLSSQIAIKTDTVVNNLLTTTTIGDHGQIIYRVIGVNFTEICIPQSNNNDDNSKNELKADAVVLATGGFSNDHTENSLLKEFAPHLVNYPTTNGVWATGDGVKMARNLNAMLVDMDKLQLHPTGLINPKDPAGKSKFLGPEALRGSGGILLNSKGKRFVNELELRSVVSREINAQNDIYPNSEGARFAYCVLNEVAANLFGRAFLGFYVKMGLFQEVPSLKKLAELIDCDKTILKQTLDTYKSFSEKKEADELTHKQFYPCVLGSEGPFWVALVTPSIHYAMGGLLIAPTGEVYGVDDTVIPQPFLTMNNNNNKTKQKKSKITTDKTLFQYPIQGLLGAGEVTGGVHGNNRLGGNSLLECVVYGRIAGERAASILQTEENPFIDSNTGNANNKWIPVVVAEIFDPSVYGPQMRVLSFALPGLLQDPDITLGSTVVIRLEWEGKAFLRYFSPLYLPSRKGSVLVFDDIVYSDDDDNIIKNINRRFDNINHKHWSDSLRPGVALEMKKAEGFRGLAMTPISARSTITFNNREIKSVGMIALGPRSVAPMLQVIQAVYLRSFLYNKATLAEENRNQNKEDNNNDINNTNKIIPTSFSSSTSIISDRCTAFHLIHSVKNEKELVAYDYLQSLQEEATSNLLFKYHPTLEDPSPSWTVDVEGVTDELLHRYLPLPPSISSFINRAQKEDFSNNNKNNHRGDVLILVSGPEEKVRKVVDMLERRGYGLDMIETLVTDV